MNRFWRWCIAILVIAVCVGVAIYIWRTRLHAPENTTAASAPAEEKPEPGHLKLTAEQIEHAGIKIEKLTAGTLEPTVELYGTIQENPGASFTVRAERAGTLEPIADKPWPTLGENLPDHTTIGVLVVRPIPADQIALASQRTTLETQLATAQADANTAKASLAAAKATYDRMVTLNAQDKNVSDRAVEDALAKMKAEEARLTAANQTLQLAHSALDALQATTAPSQEKMQLIVQRGGEVVEVTAHPGEAIEAGQPVLRVSHFDHPIAAITVPPGMEIATPEASIIPLAQPDHPFKAVRVGLASAADPKTKGQVLLYRVTRQPNDPAIRPGTPVTARLRVEGEPLRGITIPESAVVRYLGKAWVYIAGDEKTFERREVTLDHRTADNHDWFVLQGFKKDEQIVTTGAAMLLSLQVNAAFGGGGD
jgi:multidrug efflux pump subunit AcrA (membrane-fusion protein)